MNRAARIALQAAAVALMLCGAATVLPHGDLLAPGAAPRLIAGLAMMALGYLGALAAPVFPPAIFWAMAAGLRLAMIAMEPGDDIYRYVWEGRVLAAGENPYVLPPEAPELAGHRDGLWERVALRRYTAIYPPLAEIGFALLAAAGAGTAVFKGVFALADLAVCAMLAARFGARRALVYAWNPLAIYCFAGGGHYDSLFLAALVGAWWAWDAGQRGAIPAALLAGAAVALKWMALPLVCWIAWRSFRRAGIAAGAAAAVACTLPLTLGWLAISAWTGEWTAHLAPAGFARYARSAEFLPALAGAAGHHPAGNALIAIPLCAAWGAVILRCRTFAGTAEWALFAAFLLSPLMHAWYFTWLLPFAVLSRNRGTIALCATGIAYFILPHRAASGDAWVLEWHERALIWFPFVAGFIWSAARSRSVPGTEPLPQQRA